MKKAESGFYGLVHIPGSGTATSTFPPGTRCQAGPGEYCDHHNPASVWFWEGMAVVVVRSILGPILGGSPTGILYSLTGGVLSCIIMAVLYLHFREYFSLLGISVAGAVFHNVGQLLTASLLYGTIGILFTYMPLLMLSSVITGNFIGLVAKYIIRFLNKKAAHGYVS